MNRRGLPQAMWMIHLHLGWISGGRVSPPRRLIQNLEIGERWRAKIHQVKWSWNDHEMIMKWSWNVIEMSMKGPSEVAKTYILVSGDWNMFFQLGIIPMNFHIFQRGRYTTNQHPSGAASETGQLSADWNRGLTTALARHLLSIYSLQCHGHRNSGFSHQKWWFSIVIYPCCSGFSHGKGWFSTDFSLGCWNSHGIPCQPSDHLFVG